MSGCFISYRRSDSGPWAGRLRDRLVGDFPNTTVFFDVDSIELGQDFRTAINSTLEECNVVLVLIGPEWLAPGADGRPRLDDPNDVHRIEVATALASPVRVIPVLVGGATMPSADVLTADLQPLAFRNALVIDHNSFSRDVDMLDQALRRIEGFDSPTTTSAAVLPPVAAATTTTTSKRPLFIGLGVLVVAAIAMAIAVASSSGNDAAATTTIATTVPTTVAPTTVPTTAAPSGTVVLPPAASLFGQAADGVVAQLEQLGLKVERGEWCSNTLDMGLVRQITLGSESNAAVLITSPSESTDPQAIVSLKVGDTVTVWVVTQRGGC